MCQRRRKPPLEPLALALVAKADFKAKTVAIDNRFKIDQLNSLRVSHARTSLIALVRGTLPEFLVWTRTAQSNVMAP